MGLLFRFTDNCRKRQGITSMKRPAAGGESFQQDSRLCHGIIFTI
ncbi:hypothetical protein CLOSTHATH_02828 [Hungatella hathewayi DSM 13479]|uniref:Uncharacterized protein n=1 Tax=Hungatella hathewayi DSM 13479 TaxID=566550 RepID=D3AGU1_9FIRM|nr:hypothetical protein CLOSTHATH_02828 [Hungatella hathewayi DSM 13479]